MVRTSSMYKIIGLCLCLLFLFQGDALGQGKRKREITPERLAKLINAATQGSPVVRPQAAKRLEKMGPVAHKAVLEYVQGKTDLFGVGPELLEVAAGLTEYKEGEDTELRERFWKLAFDLDFPWRAALIAGLGSKAQDWERTNFDLLFNDRLVAVRLAVLKSLEAYEPGPFLLSNIQARLEIETEGIARRALACSAFRLGHKESLWVLYSELSRSDYFFDQPVGLVARLEAAKFLRAFFPEGPEFDAQAKVDTPQAVAQRKAWHEHIEAIAGPKPEPATDVGSVAPSGTPLLGLELRSCRSGEFFIRWTDQDQVWIGRGRPRCFTLKPGTHKSLITAAQGAAAAMGDRKLTGQPGCDQESFHMRLPGSKRSSVYLITKGPAPVPNLRPFQLDPLLRELMATLKDQDIPQELVGELVDALVDLGGDFRANRSEKAE